MNPNSRETGQALVMGAVVLCGMIVLACICAMLWGGP